MEKTWAKDQERSSKVHVLKRMLNLQMENVCWKRAKYVEMTEADIKEVDSLVEKYLYRNVSIEHLDKDSNTLSFILGNTYVMRRIGKYSSL